MILLAIELTDDERALVETIEFDPRRIGGPDAHRANGDKVVALWALLTKRGGIPKQRLRYFTDADYFIGGHGSSRQQWFERNGARGEDLLRHGNFLHHLHYMIFGPPLTASIVAAFQQAVADCGTITSGDLSTLAKTAKSLARTNGLDSSAKDLFFQLAIEFGMDAGQGRYIRDAVATL